LALIAVTAWFPSVEAHPVIADRHDLCAPQRRKQVDRKSLVALVKMRNGARDALSTRFVSNSIKGAGDELTMA
jgi:hypothetical protein